MKDALPISLAYRAADWAFAALAGLAVVAFAAWFYIALVYLRFGDDISGWEGAMVDHVRRVVQGQPLYAQPNLEFSSLLYGPLYYWLCAALAWAGDLAFVVPRGVSIAATLVSTACLAALTAQLSGRWLAGVLSAGIFFAAAPWADNWLALGHVDALQLALMLTALLLWSGKPTAMRLIGCGVALMAAILTKQSALLVGLLIGVDGVLFRRRELALVVAGALVAALPAIGLLAYHSGEWAWRFLIDMPRKFGLELELLTAPLLNLKRMAPGAALGALVIALLVLKGVSWRRLLLPVVALIGVGWLGRMHPGSGLGTLIPMIAGLALLAGLGAGWAMGCATASIRWLGAAILLVQFGLLAYDPRGFLPPVEATQAVAQARAAVSALPVNALIMGNGFLIGRIAGAEPIALRDYLATLDPVRRENEIARLRAELAQRDYPTIVATQLGAEILAPLLGDKYRPAKPLLRSPRESYDKVGTLVLLERR